MSPTPWSPWASAVCECERGLSLDTGAGGLGEEARLGDQEGQRAPSAGPSTSHRDALFCPGCPWQLLATWMGPWPSMTCPHRPSGTSVSTRYRLWGSPGSLGASAPDLAPVQSSLWSLIPPSLLESWEQMPRTHPTSLYPSAVGHRAAAVGGRHRRGLHLQPGRHRAPLGCSDRPPAY